MFQLKNKLINNSIIHNEPKHIIVLPCKIHYTKHCRIRRSHGCKSGVSFNIKGCWHLLPQYP